MVNERPADGVGPDVSAPARRPGYGNRGPFSAGSGPGASPGASAGRATDQPGRATRRVAYRKPPTYLLPAVASAVLCCPVTAIAAIAYATQVSHRWAVGDYRGAARASRNARLWLIIGVAVWIALFAAVVAFALANPPKPSRITGS